MKSSKLRTLRNALAGTLAAGVCLTASPVCAAEPPFNRIVVEIDASGSYQSRQNDAIAKVDQLLAGVASRRNKRWEKSDEIVIISLDAIPEIIWKGTPAQLRQTNKTEWAKRFKARTDYAECTDVNAAFELAARQFETTPKAADDFFFIFSDLIHEPPAASITKCAAAKTPSVPGDDFSWDRFENVKIAAFWLPPAQKLAWNSAMKDHGLTAYRLLTNSESAVTDIDIPEPAKRTVSETEHQQARERAASWGSFILQMFEFGGSAVALLFLGMVGYLWRRRGQQRISVPPARGRAVAGPVRPMQIPRRPTGSGATGR